MKTKMVLVLLLFLGGMAHTQAQPYCDGGLMRQAYALDYLSDGIGDAHRHSLCGHRICMEDQRFLDVVHGLQAMGDAFRRQVECGGDPACLSRTLAGMSRSYACVQAQASQTRLAPETRAMICRFGEVMSSVNLWAGGRGGRY